MQAVKSKQAETRVDSWSDPSPLSPLPICFLEERSGLNRFFFLNSYLRGILYRFKQIILLDFGYLMALSVGRCYRLLVGGMLFPWGRVRASEEPRANVPFNMSLYSR